MADKKRRRKRENPANRQNAIHVTVYDPQGGPVHPEILDDIQEAVQHIVDHNRLLVATART